jgi:hypothetical protein
MGNLRSTAEFIPSPAWSGTQRRLDRHWQILIDPVPGMCRTTVNVFSGTCVTVVVARSEGETSVLSG